jgi:ABC-type multidrug transport system ATPase subunit
MIEPILEALIQLFALISDVHDISEISSKERGIVRLFLSRQLNNELVDKYMEMFDEYLTKFNAEKIARGTLKDMKRTSLTAVRILGICEKINEELQQKQKLYVLVQLLDFILFGAEITENELEFLETVSIAFNIPHQEFQNIKSFILKSVDEIPGKGRVMIIDNNSDSPDETMKHLFRENLQDSIFVLHIESTNNYILKYSGKENLFLNGQNIFPGQTYTFDHGSTIRGSALETIYYNDISSVFSDETFKLKISLDANDVSLRFKKSEYGIQKLNYHEESGNLVGILGGSGVGKTTLLNVLSGITKPQNGEVLINGYNLYSEEGRVHLKGVIGFVPQDDLLIEELTVYQNLYYSAKMCLNNLPEDKLVELVDNTLAELDLDETRDLKVGNSLNKVISGGQRKRLNIALELIREPTILFVDEPTSGLSSVDSEIVMNLLKEQTDRGKLVIVNIHQPGSDLYKMFDKIMIIDKGGYQIFYGNPSEAIVYFKTRASYANAHEDQCVACGNVNSDQLLQIIEAKVINEKGKHTRLRKVSPKEWAEMFRANAERINKKVITGRTELPENFYSLPGLIKQSRIFFLRDSLSKIANRQYILISLLGAPLLALLLSYFTKYTINGEYHFSENENLPSYLFMSIITSLFLGLIISAEEIVKDRKILKRESFLNLSWFSYLNSKVLILFLISAIQTISFILIGNYILEIKDMTFTYWLVLFTTSCFANILGLNISSAFSSVITIYILIPFILIPQLLFSGYVVHFDKLHKNNLSSSEYVPLIGDLMTVRWSFEALAVEQFKNNKYEKNIFKYQQGFSQNDWYSGYLINTILKRKVEECLKLKDSVAFKETTENNFYKLNYYIGQLDRLAGFTQKNGSLQTHLSAGNFNHEIANETVKHLDSLSRHFQKVRRKYLNQLDSVISSIEKKTSDGNAEYAKLKSNYHNDQLESIVLDQYGVTKYTETDKKIIQKLTPGYMMPTSKSGRTHFYAPYKQIGSIKIDTYWFNLLVLWLVSFGLYIALYYNLLQKLIEGLGKVKLKEASR